MSMASVFIKHEFSFQNYWGGEGPNGIVANMVDCNIVVSEFEL